MTWSEGFRRGGVNALPIGNCYYCETPALLTYKPDEARNTEVGIKGSFGHGSSYTFTLYNIDWKDPQIEAYTVTGGFDFVTNGNTARSRGAESELTLVLLDSTKLELGYSYTDAILTSSFQRGIVPDLIGVSGDRLPEVSKQQATAALDYSLPIAGNRDFHARLDASYRSDFWTALPHSPTATDLPGFALVNARAGFGFAGSWRVDAFVNNLTNQEAATSVSTTPGPAHDRAYFVGRPRTVGLDLNYSFKDHPLKPQFAHHRTWLARKGAIHDHRQGRSPTLPAAAPAARRRHPAPWLLGIQERDRHPDRRAARAGGPPEAHGHELAVAQDPARASRRHSGRQACSTRSCRAPTRISA